MKKKIFTSTLILLVLAVGVYYGAPRVFAANGGWFNAMSRQNGWNMMTGSGWSGAMGSMMNAYGQINELRSADVEKEVQNAAKNAVINKKDNSITYSGNNVKIVMLGGPEQTDEKFVIDGLVNPTVHVSKGTKVTIELINEDKGMPHGIEITNAQPPYPFMSMMNGGIYPGSFIHPIPEASDDQYPEDITTFTADESGAFYYICQYPGHAANGMYGKFIIE